MEKIEEEESDEMADQFPDTLPQRPARSLHIQEPVSEKFGSISQTL